MKKYLLPKNGNFYKANMHCHTTWSDGQFTPEEVKEAYVSRGYSIVAYTDHNVFLQHHHLTDDKFLALGGFEVQIYDLTWSHSRTRKTAHICSVALDPETVNQPCFHKHWYTPNHAREFIKYDESKPDYVQVYSGDGVTDFITRTREEGFFVTYNHPTWSLESYPEYSGYRNMNAMEICNYSSYAGGFYEYNPRVYDDLLRLGNRIYCIAGDDNHNEGDMNHPGYGSFGAFTMIKAEKLEYRSVTNALLAGHFYASQGPEIYSLTFEDGKIHMTTSPARKITMESGARYAGAKYATEETGPITEATFEVVPDCNYVRFTVFDHEGKAANTNAYFVDELFDEKTEE
jgi:hypothetical protein